MTQFLGSVFYSPERIKNVSKTIPRRLALSLLYSQRRITYEVQDKLRRNLERNKTLFQCPLEEESSDQVVISSDDDKAGKTKCKIEFKPIDRSSYIAKDDFKLAPNRYFPKEPFIRLRGQKGAYWSISPRMIDRPKHEPEHEKVEINKKSWKEKEKVPRCKRFKASVSGDPRKRRPSQRFMIMDPNLCWRDPNVPGPLDYYPKNYTVEKSLAKKVKNKLPRVFKFIPNSIVPEIQSSLAKKITGEPGPGRYEPYEVACPCRRKYEYSTEAAQKIFEEKVKRFRNLPRKHINSHLYCEQPHLRNIPGHGHVSIFKSKTFRLVKRPKIQKAAAKPKEVPVDERYMQIIKNPQRAHVYLRAEPLPQRAITIRYNFNYRPIRRKHMANANIAFNSSQPRFADQKKARRAAVVPKKPGRKTLVNKLAKLLAGGTAIKKRKGFANKEMIDRISRLPRRIQIEQARQREKVFSFAPLPQIQLLVTGDILKLPPTRPEYQLEPKDFFREEYFKWAEMKKTMLTV